MDNATENKELAIELSEEVVDGVYSNLVVVNHTETEFILDFVSVLPGPPKGRVQSRVILAPEHAKRLVEALEEHIQNYENHFRSDFPHGEEVDIPLMGKQGDA